MVCICPPTPPNKSSSSLTKDTLGIPQGVREPQESKSQGGAACWHSPCTMDTAFPGRPRNQFSTIQRWSLQLVESASYCFRDCALLFVTWNFCYISVSSIGGSICELLLCVTMNVACQHSKIYTRTEITCWICLIKPKCYIYRRKMWQDRFLHNLNLQIWL